MANRITRVGEEGFIWATRSSSHAIFFAVCGKVKCLGRVRFQLSDFELVFFIQIYMYHDNKTKRENNNNACDIQFRRCEPFRRFAFAASFFS